MRINTGHVLLFLVLAAGASGCGNGVTAPAPRTTIIPPPLVTPPPGDGWFQVADVTLSGVVFEMTAAGRVPIAGVVVANGEGNAATTDEEGFYSIGPLWVCPCAAQPWVPANTTFLWVEKDGYRDPHGVPVSIFVDPNRVQTSPGQRDVAISGNTVFDIELVRK